MVSALSGIGIILLTFFIAKRMYNKNVGYIAAAIISISGQQVIYSRTGFPQMDTTLIFCIAFYLFWEYVCNNDKRSLIYSSLFCGLTLLFHQSVYIVIFPLLIAIIFYAIRNYDNGLIKGLKYCFYFIVIMSAIFMSAQLLIMFLNSFNPSGGSDFLLRNTERVQQGFERFSITIPKLMFYPKMLWRLEGPIITTLIPFSILFVSIKACTSKTMNYISLALITIIPLIFWNLNYTSVKGIQVVMPFLALCVGVLFTEISTIIIKYFDKKELKTSTTIIFTIFILSFGYQRVFPFVKWESNYKQASMKLIDYMKIHGGTLNVSQNNLRPILSFYIGNEIDKLPADLKEKIYFDNKNIETDYRVIDWRQFIPGKSDISRLENISNNYTPIIKLNYRKEAWPIFNYHRHYDIKRIPELFNKYQDSKNIAVYDLRKKL
jgi:4-amino-4-deoxy-L-arabinose transferase-like glycosyltransferase